MRRALPLAAGLAVAALALAGCSDDSGGAMTDGVDTDEAHGDQRVNVLFAFAIAFLLQGKAG